MKGIMGDWVGYIKARCGEDRKTAEAVRKKGKSLKGCVAALLCWSFKSFVKPLNAIIPDPPSGNIP